MEKMEKKEFKAKVFGELANLAKAMAHPFRLQIIDLLAQSSRTVEEIATQIGLSMANASQHLQILKAVNLVNVQKEGHYIHYRLADAKVYALWQSLREMGIDRLAEIERTLNDFRAQKNSFQAVTIHGLLQKIADGNAIILDVRPEKEFNAGHIPGALSMPIDQLIARIANLPPGKEVVIYCRGPFCVYADEAVEILKKQGFEASRLEEGFPDWKSRHLPVDVIS